MSQYSPATELYTGVNLAADLEQLDRQWNPEPNPYAHDPVAWVAAEPKDELWSGQRTILQSIQEHRYTAVKSCHGPGKSHIVALAAGWWVKTKDDPFIVTSAPTGHQVRSVLWRYIQKVKQRADIDGKITHGQVPEWKIGEELIGFGRKPADYLDPQAAAAAFQGIHALNVLVILDEGSGIPEWLATACETLITNENSRLIVIGNPDNPTSWFAKQFRPSSEFNKITISYFDTPNATDEDISQNLKDRLVSQMWVDERKRRWGENSPLYRSKVLAEFPDVSDDVMFTPAIIEKAQLNDRSRYATKTPAAKARYGLDVARLGPDESVLYYNRGGYVRISHKWAKRDTMASVGEFRRATNDQPELVATVMVDVNGVGGGVFDRLKELNYSVVPFNGGERAYNPDKFKNRRAEAYWTTAEMMDEGLIDLDPEDLDLAAELMEHHYAVDSGGRIVVESKDDIQARLGHSPDRADAFVMAMSKAADTGRVLKPLPKPGRTTQPDDVSDVMEAQF